MDESPRETWAMYLGMFATIIPALIASDFMPEWNVLPFAGWLAIATAGTALAGAIATPYWFRGMISGALAGAGALLGMWLYVTIRTRITGHTMARRKSSATCAIDTSAGCCLVFGNGRA